MNAVNQTSQPPIQDAFRMSAVLCLVAAGAGVLVVSVYELTQPRIAANERRAVEAAVFDVLPEAASRRTFLATDGGFVPREDTATGGPAVHAGYGKDGELLGVALQAAGQGYQDVITVLYGYDPDEGEVTGMKVLRSKETPGLGSRIGTDPDFLAAFRGLDARVGSGGNMEHRIEVVRAGEAAEPWQVDAITGATISSKAVGTMVGESLKEWAPIINAHYEDFLQE